MQCLCTVRAHVLVYLVQVDPHMFRQESQEQAMSQAVSMPDPSSVMQQHITPPQTRYLPLPTGTSSAARRTLSLSQQQQQHVRPLQRSTASPLRCLSSHLWCHQDPSNLSRLSSSV